jgi:hypothetical protein
MHLSFLLQSCTPPYAFLLYQGLTLVCFPMEASYCVWSDHQILNSCLWVHQLVLILCNQIEIVCSIFVSNSCYANSCWSQWDL